MIINYKNFEPFASGNNLQLLKLSDFKVGIRVISRDISAVSFFSLDGSQTAIPNCVAFFEETEDGKQHKMSPHRDEFIIIWHGSYVMRVNDKCMLRIESPKQQSVVVHK